MLLIVRLSLDSDLRREEVLRKPLRTVILLIENTFYHCFPKNVLNKQFW